MSYPGHSLEESYISTETQSVYSTAPADWAKIFCDESWWDLIHACHQSIINNLMSDSDLTESWINHHTLIQSNSCPANWGCRIHRLHICRGVNPSRTSVLDMILDYMMVRLQSKIESIYCDSYYATYICTAPDILCFLFKAQSAETVEYIDCFSAEE